MRRWFGLCAFALAACSSGTANEEGRDAGGFAGAAGTTSLPDAGTGGSPPRLDASPDAVDMPDALPPEAGMDAALDAPEQDAAPDVVSSPLRDRRAARRTSWTRLRRQSTRRDARSHLR